MPRTPFPHPDTGYLPLGLSTLAHDMADAFGMDPPDVHPDFDAVRAWLTDPSATVAKRMLAGQAARVLSRPRDLGSVPTAVAVLLKHHVQRGPLVGVLFVIARDGWAATGRELWPAPRSANAYPAWAHEQIVNLLQVIDTSPADIRLLH